MEYEKLKSENYTNLKGVNTKKSQYITGTMEFLNLQNVDNHSVGALSSIPGSTLYTQGSSFNAITGLSDFRNFQAVATDHYGVKIISGNTYAPIYSNFIFPLGFDSPFTFVKSNYLYGANGYDFFNWTATFPIGLTTPVWQYGIVRPAWHGAFGDNLLGSGGGFSGFLTLAFSYVRADGLDSPANFATIQVAGSTGVDFNLPTFNLTFQTYGATIGSFGISGVAVWANLNAGPWYMYTGASISGYVGPASLPVVNPALATLRVNDIFTGWTNSFQLPDPDDYLGALVYNYLVMAPLGNFEKFVPTNNPSCIEQFQNQMFLAGNTSQPDTVYYSRIGELEKIDNDAFFDVRIDDGDIVSCLKAYFTQLIIFKTESIFSLAGDNPDNFSVVEVTDQYGCLSSRAVAVFNQRMWFLDRKGVCEYNGANTETVSNPVEPFFQRMNIAAARSTAMMLHVKDRNEVWCVIPIDQSSVNNFIAIYDYLADAWYFRTLNAPTALANFNLGFGYTTTMLLYGNSSGSIFNFSATFTQDNGTNYTSVIKSRFISGEYGNSSEKQFRRLYLDFDPTYGLTYPITVNFYADQSLTPALSTSLMITQFQQRYDFGIPAKELSVEIIYSGGKFLKLNGFTLEYRFQRPV